MPSLTITASAQRCIDCGRRIPGYSECYETVDGDAQCIRCGQSDTERYAEVRHDLRAYGILGGQAVA
jgi:hypothetical protein